MILKWVRDGRCWHIHFGTPCIMYSIAWKKKFEGIRYSISYKCTQFTAKMIRICTSLGITFSLENPKTSRLFKVPCIASALEDVKNAFVEFDCCRYGISFKKPTVIATSLEILQQLFLRCKCPRGVHEHLRGRIKLVDEEGNSKWYWKISLVGEYSGVLYHRWASLLQQAAPSSAFRTTREPEFLPALHEIQEVSCGRVPISIKLKPCPRTYKYPWEHAEATWGTEPKRKTEGDQE